MEKSYSHIVFEIIALIIYNYTDLTSLFKSQHTISSVLNLKRNSFDFLRFFFAVLIIFHHTFVLGGFGEDPLNILTNYSESAGTIAVSGFFIISGFLITRSLISSQSLISFTIKRALRILPAFWVCLLVTAFIFAPLVYFIEKGTLDGLFTSTNDPFQYIRSNFFILMHQYRIAGLLSNVPHPYTFDGSLWTLFLEVKAYAILGILGLFGIKKYIKFIIPVIFIILWSIMLFNIPIKDSPNKFLRLVIDGSFLHFATYFFSGAMFFIFSEKIPLNKFLFFASTFLFVIFIPLGLLHDAMPVILPFIIFWSAAKLPFQNFGARGDYSYGLYIYSFPIQQLLSFFKLNIEAISYFLMAFAISSAFAAMSWFIIEKPALSLKKISDKFFSVKLFKKAYIRFANIIN